MKKFVLISVLCMIFCSDVRAAESDTAVLSNSVVSELAETGEEMQEVGMEISNFVVSELAETGEDLQEAGMEISNSVVSELAETGEEMQEVGMEISNFIVSELMETAEDLQEGDADDENDTSVIIYRNDVLARQLGVSDIYKANPYNDIDDLNLPAQITRQGDFYFIVDTYNDQVLYSADLRKPVNEWRVMDRNLDKPHAVASDGSMYLVVDTENNRVLCYEYVNGRFQNTQEFDDIGTRPHYIQYDAASDLFFVWSSLTGDMYMIGKLPEYNYLYLKEIRHIYELDGFYVRSFSIEGDEILFPSGNNSYMIVADKETLRVKNQYPVPAEISGMAFAKKIGNYYYMTVSTDEKLSHKNAKMIRTPDLQSLSMGLYEDVTGYFEGMRVPYYIDEINGSYYVTSHEGRKDVYQFCVVEDMIVDVKAIY